MKKNTNQDFTLHNPRTIFFWCVGFFIVEMYFPVQAFVLQTLYPNKYTTETYITSSAPFLDRDGENPSLPGEDR
ncbi:hypothetical protein DRQ25_15520 [Candidatus Fermentibacteria bacterium]|nr:MAG: hypothetical protein DRQ25_15520 [Candidatus Fermentibacteria bacterium]